ncbi:tyrosine-protein phosphatase [Fimbriimonas ginsengisoli]|uniref:protein-tyrosine-phosphatase n=1 Tax=Fimbriimonas ginsengisoli Gsoil 348 TaxID=661478 RepID=A0A068NV84_FIMGI|nr:CpsB/CapC family capsule biosynthesis tyrosine phosphatase [Fimbriimonas ginsengisoli]AIE86675.1 protein-tyrosine-phosphatase [Fimbriimonas ginsengisoli Gsoil 348]
MIDIHCHILPGVDDGAQSDEEAIALIRKEVQGGTRAFIATPHFIERRDYDRLRDVGERVERLNRVVSDAEIEAEIYPGGEIYPTAAMFEAMDKGVSITLAGKGRHMLVDLPMGSLPHDFDQILYEIQVRGIVPILAHPERCAPFQEEPDRLQEYLQRGIVCQVNARSLVGKYGPRAIEVAKLILRRRWAHFLASDGHRASSEPVLGTAYAMLVPTLGAEYVDLLTRRSAAQVLQGEALPELPAAPPQPEQKGWLSRLLRK